MSAINQLEAIYQSESFLQASASEKMEAIYQSDYFLQVSASLKTASENMMLEKTKMDSLSQNMDEILIAFPNCARIYRNAEADFFEKKKAMDEAANLTKSIAIQKARYVSGLDVEMPALHSDAFLQACSSFQIAKDNHIDSETKYKSHSSSFYDLERQYHTYSKDHHEVSHRHDYYSQTVDDKKNLIERIAIHTSLKCCGIDSTIPRSLPSPHRSLALPQGGGLRHIPRDRDWDVLAEEERRSSKIQ